MPLALRQSMVRELQAKVQGHEICTREPDMFVALRPERLAHRMQKW